MDKGVRKNWLDTTDLAIENTRKEDLPYTTEVLGKKIVVLPNVFSPKYFSDIDFFSKEVPRIVQSRSFLEIGVGTGVVSLFVALNGAPRITGTDINPDALKNTSSNFQGYGLKIELFEGDVFDPIPEGYKFDYIFWNHPFNSVDYDISDVLLKSVFDTKFEGLRKYFSEAHEYLNKNGTLILGTGQLADQDEVLRIAEENNWLQIELREKESTHRVGGAKPMRLYILLFQEKEN